MTPLNNFVIVSQEVADTVTAGGIIIDSKPKRQMKGVVTKIGPDVKNKELLGKTAYFTEIHFVGTDESQPIYVINEEKVFAFED